MTKTRENVREVSGKILSVKLLHADFISVFSSIVIVKCDAGWESGKTENFTVELHCIVCDYSKVLMDMYARLLINHLSEHMYPAEMARLR